MSFLSKKSKGSSLQHILSPEAPSIHNLHNMTKLALTLSTLHSSFSKAILSSRSLLLRPEPCTETRGLQGPLSSGNTMLIDFRASGSRQVALPGFLPLLGSKHS